MVKCLDEATGKLLWQLVVPKRTNLEPATYFTHQDLGVCSSPTVEGDRVYVVTSADEVVCLDVHGQTNPTPAKPAEGRPAADAPPADAKVIWRYDLINELRVSPHDSASCSVLIHGDVLYVGTSNGVDKSHEKIVSPDAPALVALDKRTGRLLATENEKISTRLFHCQWSSPSLGKVGDKTLIFFGGADGVCYAFEALDSIPDKPVYLKKVWSYDCNPPSYKFRDGKPIHYTDGDKRKRLSPNKDDGLYVGPSEIIATPVFHNNRVYVAIGQDPMHGRGRGMLHCIDATKTGDITETGRIWSYDGLDRTISLGDDRRRPGLHSGHCRPGPLPGRRFGQVLLGLRDRGPSLGQHPGGGRQTLFRDQGGVPGDGRREGSQGPEQSTTRISHVHHADRRQRRPLRRLATISLGASRAAGKRLGRSATSRKKASLQLVVARRRPRSSLHPPRFAASREHVGSASSHFTSPEGP